MAGQLAYLHAVDLSPGQVRRVADAILAGHTTHGIVAEGSTGLSGDDVRVLVGWMRTTGLAIHPLVEEPPSPDRLERVAERFDMSSAAASNLIVVAVIVTIIAVLMVVVVYQVATGLD